VLQCPQCEYEFPEGVTICPDCQAVLIEKKSAISGAAVVPDESWVKVWGVRSKNGADRARRTLDSHNIPSVIMASAFAGLQSPKAEYAAMADAPSAQTIIMVPREFRDEAEIILESVLGYDDFYSEIQE
jgi:hypothetical protein